MKSGWLLETKNYEFDVFENLKIHFFGFDAFKLDTLKEVVRKHNGSIVKDVNWIITGEDFVNFIVVSQGANIDKLNPIKSKVFVVNILWLYNCLKYDRFIYPEAFLLTPSTRVLSKINLKLKESDLDWLINETESDAKAYDILCGCIFYFYF